MEIQQFKKLLSDGQIDLVINGLISFSEKFHTEFNKVIYQTSTRYKCLINDENKGIVNRQDYTIERNSLTSALLEIINSIEKLDPKYLKTVASPEQIKFEIEKLAEDFDECQKIKSVSLRLRRKNNFSRQICEKFIQMPFLINEFKQSSKDGIICGIADKIKLLPDIDDLEVLEEISKNTNKNFTKGTIVNAIAEVLYLGIGIGDDLRIDELLDLLDDNVDVPLGKNIERVRVALHYVIGKIK